MLLYLLRLVWGELLLWFLPFHTKMHDAASMVSFNTGTFLYAYIILFCSLQALDGGAETEKEKEIEAAAAAGRRLSKYDSSGEAWKPHRKKNYSCEIYGGAVIYIRNRRDDAEEKRKIGKGENLSCTLIVLTWLFIALQTTKKTATSHWRSAARKSIQGRWAFFLQPSWQRLALVHQENDKKEYAMLVSGIVDFNSTELSSLSVKYWYDDNLVDLEKENLERIEESTTFIVQYWRIGVSLWQNFVHRGWE